MMSGDVIIGYWSRETSHYSSHHRNIDGICDDEIIEVYLSYIIHVHRSIDNIHSSSFNLGGYPISDYGRGASMSQGTSHSSSCNGVIYHCGVAGRGVTRALDTIHVSSHNRVSRVDVEGRGGYNLLTSHSSLIFSVSRGILSSLSFTFRPVDENVHEYYRGGYSGHGYENGGISCGDGDGRRNISCDYGYLRGDIRVDDVRFGYIYKDTSHFSSSNIGEYVFGDWRFGYRFLTSHYSSHNLGEHGRLLRIPGASRHVDDSLHENEIVYSRSDGARCESRSQEISHSSFHNDK